MKRNILFLLIMAISVVSYGQKKPKIKNALKAAEEGNLGEAKDIIDRAIEHEKTLDDPETWYYRGLIYAALDTTSNPEYQNLDNDPLTVAAKSFDKAEEMNKGKELYISGPNGLPVLKSQQEQMIWGHYLNKGVQAFQSNDPAGAQKWFEKCQIVIPEDTTCTLYAGLAAQNAENFDDAARNFYKLINELDNHDPDIYNSLIFIEANKNEDFEKALELVRESKRRWPGNAAVAKTEINILLKLGRQDQAKEELEAAIAEEPDNADLYFTLGVLNEETDNDEAALEAYLNAQEVDPTHFNSAYNAGVLTFNMARELIVERNALGTTAADNKKYEKLTLDIEEGLRKSLPYWLKVVELEPSNRQGLEQLRFIYVQLKQNEKAQEIQNKLDEYGYSDEG